MTEQPGAVTFLGNPLTLLGPALTEGDVAPDFQVLDNDLQPKTLADYKGKVLILSVVPSLDTPVCDLQTRWFNKEAVSLGNDVRVLTLSMDLPFAQKRWCGAAGVENVVTLSDHRDASFGQGYGTLIKELRLLTRAVFVVDQPGVVRYIQMVKEVTHEPDYEAVLDAVRKVTG